MSAPYFVAPDADDEPTLWRHDPDRPDYPQPVLRRFEVGDSVVWDGLAAWAAGGMSAPTPDLPAVTLTDEERETLLCDCYALDGDGHGDFCALNLEYALLIPGDVATERVERIVAARLAAQPVAPAPDRDALAEALRDVFRGDEYEENAAAAAGEGEWSWFAWLAATAGVDAVLAALAARPAPSGDADLAARVQARRDDLADALNGAWPHIMNDGFQSDVAAFVADFLADDCGGAS